MSARRNAQSDEHTSRRQANEDTGGYARRWLHRPQTETVTSTESAVKCSRRRNMCFAAHYPEGAVRPEAERRLLRLVCEARLASGLPPMQRSTDLVHLARAKAWDMVQNGYFDHESPRYGSVYDMMRRAEIPFDHAGENLGRAGNHHVVHSRLMASSGHRRNILNPRFDQVGIGAVSGEFSGVVIAQIFNGRRGNRPRG